MSNPIKRKFPKSDLLEVLDCNPGEQFEGYTKVTTKMTGKRRWSLDHYMVFKLEDKFYMAHYSVGATESQDESPWEYEGDEIECVEVEPKEETVIVYRAVTADTTESV
jgi:uncharacterized cupredoxin-like copper-binding protein